MLLNNQARSPFVLKHTTSLLASERSERDTIRGNSIEISLYLFSEASEASGADSLMSSRYIYIYLGLEIVFVLEWAYVCTLSPTRLRGPGNLLSDILFCLPAVRSSDAQ